jgi:hypothetical protein
MIRAVLGAAFALGIAGTPRGVRPHVIYQNTFYKGLDTSF